MQLRMNRLGTIVLGGMTLATGLAVAQDKPAIPDAQVEANVLRQLAGAPELSTQNIQTQTVYGVVTLSGSVQNEALRTKAENLAARSEGVKKVVDTLTLSDAPMAANDAAPQGQPAADPNDPNMPAPGGVLQSDGTYAPAPGQDPAQQQGGDPSQQANAGVPPPPNGGYGQPNYGPAGPPPGRQPMYNAYGPAGDSGPYAGQKAGLVVTVPAGAPLQVRINRGLDSNEVKPGDTFDGMVMYDIVAGGAVAIPRGATVSGTVVDAKKAGTLKGRGELSLNITSVTLGGQVYPIQSAVWDAHGRDKTTGTVNSAVGTGIFGAVVGAVVGGGKGALIGAGVGAGVGVADSAASPNGRVILRPESIVSFSLAQPAAVTTVSQQEMARLSYAAGPPPAPRPGYRRRYYSPGYGYYYGPAY
jgi:BON domain